MKYVRLHADKNGNTPFRGCHPQARRGRLPAAGAAGVRLARLFRPTACSSSGCRPAGRPIRIHVPKKQFLICLKGHLEVTASDGKTRSFGPGDTVF